MIDDYKKGYVEVLEILSYFPSDEYSKIPKEKIEFYQKNKDCEYVFKINPDVDLSEQNISKEANAILVSLYRDYFANERQKEILNNLLKQNQEKVEEKKREIYNPDNIFKKTDDNIEVDNAFEETKEMRTY